MFPWIYIHGDMFNHTIKCSLLRRCQLMPSRFDWKNSFQDIIFCLTIWNPIRRVTHYCVVEYFNLLHLYLYMLYRGHIFRIFSLLSWSIFLIIVCSYRLSTREVLMYSTSTARFRSFSSLISTNHCHYNTHVLKDQGSM